MHERVTHSYQGDLALFLIGMRVHRPWRLDVVGRTFLAMPPMIAELERSKAAAARGEGEDLGYLGSRTVLEGFSPTVIQYWRSVEDIYRYASSADHRHRAAWAAFNRYAAASPGAVTIWHETYAIPAGHHESVYGGPGRVGLATLEGVVPVAQRGRRARERMGASAA